MRKIIKITTMSAFLIAMSALSVNAQQCFDPNCPFNTNNIKMNGPKDMLFIGGGGWYTLPNVYGANYTWYNNGILQKKGGGYNDAEYRVPSTSWEGYNCYYDFVNNKLVCDGYKYELWDYPYDTTDVIECVVTYNGHTHYFYKKIFIWAEWKPGLDLQQ